MVQESKEEVTLFGHHRLLRDLIDPEHPLVKLAESIDWESLEEELKEAYPSTTGHPNRPIRLMGGLHYLRYMFNLKIGRYHHVKQHHRMDRNFLKGRAGDQLNTILAAWGYNLKKIYKHFLKAYRK